MWWGAPAGLISGPMIVKKIVLMPRASSGKKTLSMIGWKLGAYRKLIPPCSVSWRPWSGVSSATTPRASRASALPELADIDRLPCLATGTPAAAVRMALAVLTLKVVRPPPVPHMSVRFPSTFGWIWTQLARMARAMAATSSTFGPFMRRATRKPAIWTSVTWSSRMASTNSVSSCAVRSCFWVSLPNESLNTAPPPWSRPSAGGDLPLSRRPRQGSGSARSAAVAARPGGESVEGVEYFGRTPELVALPVAELDEDAGLDERLERPVGVLRCDPDHGGDEGGV